VKPIQDFISELLEIAVAPIALSRRLLNVCPGEIFALPGFAGALAHQFQTG
jgi:hypothetical protein